MTCYLLPFLNANHRHHTHYTHGIGYGPPYVMGWDILPLSPFAHWLVHFPWGRVRNQNAAAKSIARWLPQRLQPLALALMKYPHPGQQCLHAIARFNGLWLRLGITVRRLS